MTQPSAVDIFTFFRVFGSAGGPLAIADHLDAGGEVFHVSMEAGSDSDFLEKVIAKGRTMQEERNNKENA